MSPTVLSYVEKGLDSLLMSYSGGVQRAREGPVEECPRNDSRVNEMVIIPLASRPVPVVVSSSSMSGSFILQQQMRGGRERRRGESLCERTGEDRTGQDRPGSRRLERFPFPGSPILFSEDPRTLSSLVLFLMLAATLES